MYQNLSVICTKHLLGLINFVGEITAWNLLGFIPLSDVWEAFSELKTILSILTGIFSTSYFINSCDVLQYSPELVIFRSNVAR
jgi:hypothetical protein